MDKKLAHLQMIQAVVSRMATASFQLKGWSVVLVSALFALAGADAKVAFVFFAYLPSIVFWILDGYFLRQERLFRKLYDDVRKKDADGIDFSMDTSAFKDAVASVARAMLSKTLAPFHGVVVMSVVIMMMSIKHID